MNQMSSSNGNEGKLERERLDDIDSEQDIAIESIIENHRADVFDCLRHMKTKGQSDLDEDD